MRDLIEKSKKAQALRDQLEKEPWIRFRNSLVSKLVNKRRELGISQSEMAKALNSSQSSVTRFESMALMKNGESTIPPNPTMKFIASYAAVLGYNIEIQLIPSETQENEQQ